jgi:hypothetical protein
MEAVHSPHESRVAPPLNGSNLSKSAVSWAAIFAGAVVAAAASLLLLALAAGLNLASVSPWPNSGVSAASAALMTGIGLIVIQWVASALGGYITGRLRTKWVGTHTHEVFFRDTAHGLITWALATVVVAAATASAAASLIGGGVRAVSTVVSGVAGNASTAATPAAALSPYDLDVLFRPAEPDAKSTTSADARTQAARIFARGLVEGDNSNADRAYLANVVASQTGISQADAQRRVDEAVSEAKAAQTQAREAAETARKAAEMTSILTAASMLIGAFIACVSAALGGRLRDLHP